MRIFVRLFLLLSLIFASGCTATPKTVASIPTEFIAWQTFDSQAVWYSNLSKKPILLYFYGENCVSCDQVKKQLFSNRDIVIIINNYFTPIRLHNRSNKTRHLMQQFAVREVPAVVVLSHVDRSVLSKMVGAPAPIFFYNNLKICLQMDRVKAIQGVLIGG